MAMFDLEKTASLERLFRVPQDQRDLKWLAAFYTAAPEASLMAREQQLIDGPDGFRYFALYIPPEKQEFDAFCVAHIASPCLENGVGCVINPDKSPPDWVFSYGNLWSFLSTGTFDARPSNPPPQKPMTPGRQVLVAAPSQDFLPAYARKALRGFLEASGVKDPRVLLISDVQSTPTQSLAFSIYPENFPNTGVFTEVMNRLRNWFLPPHYGLMALPKGQYEQHFVPLAV